MAFDTNRQLDRAKRYLEKNKIEDAIEAYQSVLTEIPGHVESLQALGDIYTRLGQPDRAGAFYGPVFDRLFEMREEPRALVLYTRALKGGQQPPERMSRYALLLQKQNRAEEAIEQLLLASELFLARGKEEPALDCLERVAQLEPDDALRRDLCAGEFIHVYPSRAQLMDGLAQFVVSRKWRDILVFEGPLPADVATTAAFAHSAQKFGARIVANQHFKPGTDPRDREQNEPALLSAINRDFDAVFVADEAFDFARTVPYHLARSRPVIGSIDLEPMAWHWTWERHGAPQVNSRFERKSAGRHMQGADWAAWMAVKMIVQSALRTEATDFAKQRAFILGDGRFDGDKGLAVSVRPWDHQLRQAVLLAAPFAYLMFSLF